MTRDPVAAARALLEKFHADYWDPPIGLKAIEGGRQVYATGLDLEIVENACLTAPTAEAIAELRGNLTGLPEGEADWRDHPAIEPDPAEAAQAEERARIEALAREDSEQSRLQAERDLDELRAEGIDPESLGDEA